MSSTLIFKANELGSLLFFHMQACLKEIHTKKLHEHLVRLEQPFKDDEENMEQEVKMEPDHSLQVKADDDELDVKGMIQSLYLATLNFMSRV